MTRRLISARSVVAVCLCLLAGGYTVSRVSGADGGASRSGGLPPLFELRGAAMAFPLDTFAESRVPFIRQTTAPALCLPLRDGELVSLVLSAGDDGEDCLLMVAAADGAVLDLWLDGPVLRVAGIPRTLNLAGKDGWEWLAEAPDGSVEALRLVRLDVSDAARPDLLARLARHNPHVGLVLADVLDESWDALLSALQPKGLWFFDDEGPWLTADVERVVRLLTLWPSLVEVWTAGGDSPEIIDALARLPRLNRLTLHGWDPDRAGMLPAEWSGLSSLTLVEAAVEDLTGLESLHGLRELRLVECRKLKGLQGLSWLFELSRLEVREACELWNVTSLVDAPWLRSLVLSGCENVFDLSSLEGLPELEEVALPEQTTAVQFDAVVAIHPALRAVDLTGCKDVQDLSALARLPWLERVGIGAAQDPADLAQLIGLNYVHVGAVKGDDDKDLGVSVAELRKSRPDVDVVMSQPVCLGAGAILWLVGGVGLFAVWGRRVARMCPA